MVSGICIVHCLAIPVALLAAPAISALLQQTETTVHWVLLLIALPTSAFALWRGWVCHASVFTVTLGSLGLCFMLIGVTHILGHSAEIGFTLVGVSLLLWAHLRNLRHAVHTHSHD